MENANPLSLTPISELFYLKKKTKFELWFENNGSDESLVDSEEEFEGEEEEDDIDYFDTFPTREELDYHESILKNLRLPWIRAKIRTWNLNNIKIPCMISHFIKEQVQSWRRDADTSFAFDLRVFLHIRDVKRAMNSAQLLWGCKSIGTGSNFGNDLERCRVGEEMRILLLHLIFAFPGSVPIVTPTLAFTNIPVNVKGEITTNPSTKEPPSHTEGETEDPKMAISISSIQPTKVPPTQAQPITTITTHPKSFQATLRIDKGKGIATESNEDPSKKLVPASTIVRHDPDEEVKVPYMINGKMCYLIDYVVVWCKFF
nr:hypothetical protein [Tanacetum cinerariifolium]